MIRVSGIFCLMCVALLGICGSGCFSSSRGKTAEEKEPYFQEGKSLESAMDFEGAIKAFEKAVEVNPHSASAHFELGVLCEKDNRDCAAAIYHFKRYLELMSTNVPNAGMIADQIFVCKQVLARDVTLGAGAQNIQQELEKLTEENQRLRDENQKWRALNAGRAPDPATGAGTTSVSNIVSRTGNGATITEHATSNIATAAARTYKVQGGDTLAAIARKNGLKLNALLAANPGVDPQKMRVGQVLNLPAP